MKTNVLSLYKLSFLFILFLFSSISYSTTIDSLKIKLQGANDDQKAGLYTEIANIYLYVNLDSANKYALAATNLCRKQRKVKKECEALRVMGKVKLFKGKYDEAFDYAMQLLRLAQNIGDSLIIERAYADVGNAYRSDKKYDKAEEWYKLSIALARRQKDTVIIVSSLMEMAGVKIFTEKYKESIELNQEALKLGNKMGETSQNEIINNNIGLAYCELKNYPKALEHYKEAARLNSIGGKKIIYMAELNNIGQVFYLMHDYDSALYYSNKALKLNYNIPDYVRPIEFIPIKFILNTSLFASNYATRKLPTSRGLPG